MNYATIKYCDIANGEGVRTSLFVSGCRRHCPNCFNAVAWDFNYGEPFTKEVRNKILESLAPGYINGLSLLGGEPFEPENQRALVPFLRRVSRKTSGNCCPSSKTSRRCTPARPSGAIPATILNRKFCGPAAAVAR